MLTFPGKLTEETFLARHWQKKPLFMPGALARLRPSVTRNEIGWLATLDDVESRLVFTERVGEKLRYSAESGPFDPDYLAALPNRDWTLLVHDVEKHLPVMRKLFSQVSFIPDWRVDDLMISFAAPGGGVGPHCDHYDVFLCQGIGVRQWHVTTAAVADDPAASSELALTQPFAGRHVAARQGDVLYLPPGVAHWGTATLACITYSIGMRAPQRSDLTMALTDGEATNPFYRDPDLTPGEVKPGYISQIAIKRAVDLLGTSAPDFEAAAVALGRFATQTKAWITPDGATAEEASAILESSARGLRLSVHGMARIACDDRNVYVNGAYTSLRGVNRQWLEALCAQRSIRGPMPGTEEAACVAWMLERGAFELPEHS